jgi:hypothetical protein
MSKHYVYVVHDPVRRRNTIKTGPSLPTFKKKLSKTEIEEMLEGMTDEERRAFAKLQKTEKRAPKVVYYECLGGPTEAAKRKNFLLSSEGELELNRWLRRLRGATYD